MTKIYDLLKNKQTTAVICNQFGDTGKGKFSDIISEWADVIARGTGGNNAGHTVVINGKKRIFHLLPAGIIYDKEGKTNILGNGMVIDINCLCKELDELKNDGGSYNNLIISEDANIILPYHINADKSENTSQTNGGVGSTGRGIGPAYSDKIARKGIQIKDLYNKDTLINKLQKLKEQYHSNESIDEIIEKLTNPAKTIKPFVRDTIIQLHEFMKQGKKILLEGAQGLLLSIEFGTYPYVTSSDCSINGTAAGVGLSAKMIDKVFGIVKFPYMTRVGGGPFPTELGGQESEKYCASGHNIKEELTKNEIPFESEKISYDHKHQKIIELMNSKNPFQQGTGIRLAGEEYGATTGRPRRTGWTDLIALKYAIGINGPDLILTKVDVAQNIEEIKLCNGYILDEQKNETFTKDAKKLAKTTPTYQTFKGFEEDTSNIKKYEKLPSALKESITFLEKFTGGKVNIISTGQEREEYLIK